MRSIFLSFLFLSSFNLTAQLIDSLNTAKNSQYMTAEERNMIYEINLVRSNPKAYVKILQPLLDKANEVLKNYGKGSENYSLTISTDTKDGKEIKTIDTTWHYVNEEEVKALTTLIDDLNKLTPLSVLKPDNGIYKAATKHVNDQKLHSWSLMHTGSDGSQPWDRILKFSPSMSFGNENIAGNSAQIVSARDIVIQLLIDSGIPGYGHRYNLLNPVWTHAACKHDLYKGMHWWVQNFGIKKKN
jgi:uncharacterized protein YkwD